MSNIGSYNPNKPRAGNFNGPKLKYFGLTKKTPTVVGRVLPPFKSLKEKNAIAQYWSVIWLVDSNGNKRPVPSIQKKLKGQLIQADPIIEKASAMKLLIENAEKAGENPQVIAQMKERVRSIDPDKKFHLNIYTPAGEIGVLKIPYTCFQLLEAKLKELASKGLDAVGVGPTSGLFFEFKKWQDEKGLTHFDVQPMTQHSRDPQTGMIGLAYKFAPLDDTIIARMETEAGDLANLYTVRTVEEMAMLASLDPAVVSRVLMKSQPVDSASDESAGEPEENGPAGNIQGYQAPATAAPAQVLQTPIVAQTQPNPDLQATLVVQPPTTPVNGTDSPAAQAPLSQAGNPAAALTPPTSMSTQLGAISNLAGCPDDVRKFLFNQQQGAGTAK